MGEVKQVIIMVAMIALGITLFQLVAGGDDGSIMSVMKGVFQEEIQVRTSSP